MLLVHARVLTCLGWRSQVRRGTPPERMSLTPLGGPLPSGQGTVRESPRAARGAGPPRIPALPGFPPQPAEERTGLDLALWPAKGTLVSFPHRQERASCKRVWCRLPPERPPSRQTASTCRTRERRSGTRCGKHVRKGNPGQAAWTLSLGVGGTHHRKQLINPEGGVLNGPHRCAGHDTLARCGHGPGKLPRRNAEGEPSVSRYTG